MLHLRAMDFPQWRQQARLALANGIAPEAIHWQDARQAEGGLFGCDQELDAEEPAVTTAADSTVRIPASFLQTLRRLAAVSYEDRWNFLYKLLVRVSREGAGLLTDPLDEDAQQVRSWLKELHRDSHKMKAFLRFRQKSDNFYTARYEPQHFVLQDLQEFFCKRFASMNFVIETPWERLAYIGGEGQHEWTREPWQGIEDDAMDELWLTYYKHTYNPARMNLKATLAEMPKKLWKNMPETKLIPELLAGSAAAVAEMIDKAPLSLPFDPGEVKSLAELQQYLQGCRGCALSHGFGNAVPGDGAPAASIMLVGEQPGDKEERQGSVFVGPAGQVLDEALAQCKLKRESLYITNAVKHFRHQNGPTGRIHQRPAQSSVHACRPFLMSELRLVRPQVVVCLGLTALKSFFGSLARLDQPVQSLDFGWGPIAFVASCHPAAILRSDANRRAALQARLHAALAQAKKIYVGANSS